MFIKLKVYKVEVKLGARFFGIYKVLMRPEMVLEISIAWVFNTLKSYSDI